MYRIESTIVEDLKERDLSVDNLLQKYAETWKCKKQKELIEECDIIYRLSRTPKRRVFYIDTGHLPSHRAMAYLEQVKTDLMTRDVRYND